MKNHQKTEVAIAGLGFGESVHLEALYFNNHLKPSALWHPNPEKANNCSDKYNLKPFSNWSSLLNDENIKAIIIATPPKPRFDLAKEAISYGKHLLLEKPIALNYSQIEELQRLSIKNRVSVAVDFEYRAVPLFMQAKKILSSQQLGKIWFIKFDWIMSSRANVDRKWNWYSSNKEGGGVLGALGTHAFDIIHWLFGDTKTVNSHLSTAIKQRYCEENNSLKDVTSEDICLAQLELRCNETNEKIPAQISLSSISRNGRGCWIEVYGSEGSLILGSDNQKDYVHGFNLWMSDKSAQLKNIPPDKEFIFNRTWKDGRIAPVARIQDWWCESIRHGTPIIPGLREAVTSQKICDLIKESDKSGLRLSQTN